jgi:beta-aspartyl-peptidase (threonine type)
VPLGAALLCNDIGNVGLAAACRLLLAGGSALDALEAGIRPVEADPAVTSVGLGGWTNALGQVELDAGVMDGQTLAVGAVGALRGVTHAVTVARQVMERLPHVLLVGQGAARFAAECGLGPDQTLTDRARTDWQEWRDRVVTAEDRGRWPDVPLVPYARWAADPERTGTVVFLVRDQAGHMAAGASTCGWAYKYPGRLGDSCVPGAGFYADDRCGAAACTGAGELTIRAGTARSVVEYLRAGHDVAEAVRRAADEMRSLRRDFAGGVTLHALDSAGRASVLAIGLDLTMRYCYWQEGGPLETGAAVQLPWQG